MNEMRSVDNKYNRMAKKKIEKYDKPEWMLNGFYNSIVISKAYSTAFVYLYYVINFLKNVPNIEKISIDDYYGFLASLKDKVPSTQIDAYHALQKYSKYLKSKNICEDFMQYVDRPKFYETQKTKEKREKSYLTNDEAKEMLEEANSDVANVIRRNKYIQKRDYAMVMVFLNTGIRCSALCNLNIDDVDYINKTINVSEKGHKTRVINISMDTVKAIIDMNSQRWIFLDGYPHKQTKALFLSLRRDRIGNWGVYHVIKRAGVNIENKNISPHKLRATYGTQLYNKTHDLLFVQKCMGHSSPSVTELYIRGNNDNITKKAAELMDDFLKE